MQEEVKEALVDFFKKSTPGKVLDIPSGSGWLKTQLHSEKWDYFGADLYTDGEKETFKLADLNQTLPYDDHTFDYFACIEGIEHVENPHHVLRESFRLLKPGGKMILSTPNPLNIKSRRRFYREGTFYGFPHLVRMPQDGEHVHISPINLSFLISFAEKAGFKLLKVHTLNSPKRMYRYFLRSLLVKAWSKIRYSRKDPETKLWMERLVSFNVLLNDEIVVSFKKPN